MTIKLHEFDFLDEFKKQGQSAAEKLSSYQTALDEAKSRLYELTTMYEITFTSAIENGEDATAKLKKIDDDIALQKEVVARRERDSALAITATQGDGKFSTVDVVEKYNKEFVPKVSKEFMGVVNPKLQLARDLILSVIDDAREGDKAYNYLHTELTEMAITNRHSGKTSEIHGVGHPTRVSRCMGRSGGAMNGVREVLAQVSKYTHGFEIPGYQYIAVSPQIKEKAGK